MADYELFKRTSKCFGKEWEPSDVICAGGIDYVQGSVPRNRCPVFDECHAVVQAGGRPVQTGQVLRRAPSYTAGGNPTVPSEQPRQYGQYRRASLAIRSPETGRLNISPAQPQYLPEEVHEQVRYIARNDQMPSFLHVPEERAEHESWWHPLGRELGRGALKALGHVLASYMDRVPWFGKKP
jgi:hypothetical protein